VTLTSTSLERTQPVVPLGRTGTSTCSHVPWRATTENTVGCGGV
jgi:hypothetical protein